MSKPITALPRKRISLLLVLAATVVTIGALPLSAALHLGVVIFAIEQDFPLLQLAELIHHYLPPFLKTPISEMVEAYGAFLVATVFAPLLSWVGFAFFLPIFHLQRKYSKDGWILTTLIGAGLGGAAVLPISLGPLDYAMEARMMFGDKPLLYFSAMGALHAGTFWGALAALTGKTSSEPSPKSLPLYRDGSLNAPNRTITVAKDVNQSMGN